MKSLFFNPYRILPRGSARIPSGIPAQKPQIHHTIPTAIPFARPIIRPQIEQVNPQNVITMAGLTPAAPATQIDNPSLPPVKPTLLNKIKQFMKTRTAKAIAVVSTFGSIALTSSIAKAGPIAQSLSEAPILGQLIEFFQNNILNFTGKGFLAISALFIAGALVRMYFNPIFKGRPGDPTPKRILKKYVLPVLGAGIMIGAAIYSAGLVLPLIATSLQVTSSTVYGALFAAAFIYAASKALFATIRTVYENSRTVKLDLQKMSHWNKAVTVLLSYLSQFSNAVYMTYRAVTVASITAGVTLKMAYGLMTPSALMGDMLLGAGLGLLYYLGIHREVAKLVNPTQISTKPNRGVGSLLKLSGLGAAAAAMISAAGPTYAINMLAALGFFMAEAFGAQHAWRWDQSARSVENTPQKLYTDQDVMEAACSPESQHVTMFKTGFPGDIKIILPALFLNIHTRQGTNTTIAQTNGMSPQQGTGGFDNMFGGLKRLMKLNNNYRRWLKEADRAIAAAKISGKTDVALEALAEFYERFARNIMKPTRDNEFTPLYHGKFRGMRFKGFDNRPRFFGNETFIGKDKPNIEHNRSLGRRLYTLGGTFNLDKAVKLRELAAAYRNGETTLPDRGTALPGNGITKPSHEEVIKILERAVDQLYRKHNIPIMMIPPFQFENVFLRKSIAKIATTNLYQEGLRNIWTGIPLVMYDHENRRFYQLLIPTKVARVLKTDHDKHIWKESKNELNYRQVRNADSLPGEDNRYKWVDRPIHTIGDNQSDILYIDNSVHFSKHKGDLTKYPTQFDQTVPLLEKDEYFDVVYRNGSRLRMYGDRTVQHLDSQMNVISGPGRLSGIVSHNDGVFRYYGDGRVVRNIDGKVVRHSIRWLAGTAEPDYFQLFCTPRPGAKTLIAGQHDYRWVKLPELKPKYFFFDRGPFQSLSDAEQVDLIVTDFLANYERDMETPYIFLQWRIKEKRKFPADRAMLDSPHDKVMMVSPSIAFFTLQVTEKESGRKLHVPYNMQKELFQPLKDIFSYDNPRSVNENISIPEWRMIDAKEGARLVTPQTDPGCPFAQALRVRIRYTSRVVKGGKAVAEKKDYFRYLWYPLHLESPEKYAEKIEINIHPEKVGPNPFVKYTIARRNEKGKVVKRDGSTVDQKLWDTVVGFKPLSPEEHKKASQEIRDKAPVTDDNGNVTLPNGVAYRGKNTLSYFEYITLRDELLEETLYERFMPVGAYMTHYEPPEVE